MRRACVLDCLQQRRDLLEPQHLHVHGQLVRPYLHHACLLTSVCQRRNLQRTQRVFLCEWLDRHKHRLHDTRVLDVLQ